MHNFVQVYESIGDIMPTVIPQARPTITNSTEDSYRLPIKTIIAASTGMEISKEPKPVASGQTVITEEGPKEVTLSPQLTALARKEQKFRQQEQAFKAKEAAIAAKEAEVSKLAELKTKISAKDYSVLDELGISYEEWTNYLINKGESTKPEVQAVKKLEEEVSAMKKAQEEQVSKQYEATLNQYRREIKNLVDSNPEFDGIKAMKAEEH